MTIETPDQPDPDGGIDLTDDEYWTFIRAARGLPDDWGHSEISREAGGWPYAITLALGGLTFAILAGVLIAIAAERLM